MTKLIGNLLAAYAILQAWKRRHDPPLPIWYCNGRAVAAGYTYVVPSSAFGEKGEWVSVSMTYTSTWPH